MTEKSFYIETLGCPKNVVDSENMAALLTNAGFVQKDSPENSRVMIINTCCFIEPAREEAVMTILEAARWKEETGGFLIVTGCFPQKYKDEIADEIPEVDSWMGLENPQDIVDIMKRTVEGEKIRQYYHDTPEMFQDLPRIPSTPGHYAYLKISEGCSHHCSFCVIPKIRGKYRSLPLENVVENAKKLVETGHKEILLIAQDTTFYGMDLYGKKMLSDLLKRLCDIDGMEWLRLMYAYPTSLDDDVLKTIASEDKICKYLDIPLQHSHPAVLKKMGRPFKEKDTSGLIERIREIIPDVALRTSFIVGHPGETERRFLHLVDFVMKMEFYHLGVFTYSPEHGTPSEVYKTRASKIVSVRRKDELLEAQRMISANLRDRQKGKIIPAVSEMILDTETPDGGLLIDMEGGDMKGSSYIPPGTTAVGRTVYDAPDIDGVLFIKGEPPKQGTFFDAKITGSGEYDLTGVISY